RECKGEGENSPPTGCAGAAQPRVARRRIPEKDIMAEDNATNPVEGEDKAETILPDAQEVDPAGQSDQPLDEEGEAPDPAEEEIEHEGRKYLVPKALKPLLLMQA